VDNAIDTTSNGKKFNFSNIYYVIDWFSNNFLSFINMQDWDGYIIFDISIWSNKHCVLVNERIFKDIIKSILMSIYNIRVLLIYWKK